MRLPAMVVAVMTMIAASGDGYAMGGGSGGHGGGAGAGGSGGHDSAGMGESHGTNPGETMNKDHDAALSARRSGQMEPLSTIVERVRQQHGGKVLDARLVRSTRGIYYEIRVLDRRNRLLTLKVVPSARAKKRMNFGASTRSAR